MRGDRILILGGTGDARALASVLAAEGFSVITSLAGVTENPLLPEGEVRRGGFGGVSGLMDYLRGEDIAAVADATHPFAQRMSEHAEAACRETGLPLLRLERPAWKAEAGDRWTTVSSVAEAAASLPGRSRALVTIGRKEIAPFLAREDISGVARMIEPPGLPLPARWTLLLQRPPFTVEAERRLMGEHAITRLVTKNAGGTATEAKLVAARVLGIPVTMVQRPLKPAVQTFDTAEELAAAVRGLLSP
jgi:precorrin-6A/cobalt-precorrin-6A reductase